MKVNIVNRMKKDVFKMQQNNKEMIKLEREKSKLYEEFETALKTSSTIIKELIDKIEREVS